jgi:hypothetical protein
MTTTTPPTSFALMASPRSEIALARARARRSNTIDPLDLPAFTAEQLEREASRLLARAGELRHEAGAPASLPQRAALMPAPVDRPRHVRQFLDVSTAHLPEHLGIPGGLDFYEGLSAQSIDGGWWVWVPDDPAMHAAEAAAQMDDMGDDVDLAETAVPSVVLAVQRLARSLDCDYICFHQDAPIVEELPTWQW